MLLFLLDESLPPSLPLSLSPSLPLVYLDPFLMNEHFGVVIGLLVRVIFLEI